MRRELASNWPPPISPFQSASAGSGLMVLLGQCILYVKFHILSLDSIVNMLKMTCCNHNNRTQYESLFCYHIYIWVRGNATKNKQKNEDRFIEIKEIPCTENEKKKHTHVTNYTALCLAYSGNISTGKISLMVSTINAYIIIQYIQSLTGYM